MDKPRIFLGSSGMQKKVLQALTRGLEDVAYVESWKTSFNPGTTTLARLFDLAHEVDFAAVVFARDGLVTRTLAPFQEQRLDCITVDGSGELFLDSHQVGDGGDDGSRTCDQRGQIWRLVERQWAHHRYVGLRWTDVVKLVWRESGGPTVCPPTQKGFGSHLIERAFGGQLGTAQLVFSPEGLCCTLDVRL